MPRGVKRGRGRPRKIVAKKTLKREDKAQEVAVRKNGPVNEESKALFLNHHLPAIAKFKEQMERSKANLRNAYKSAKKDGFLQRDFDTAFKLRTETGEKEIKALIARDGTIAKWLGYGLGKQLDLFLEAGEEAEMEAVIERIDEMADEIMKLDPPPVSGVAMTRSQFKAQQRLKAQADAAEDRALFKKRSSPETAA
jgi:hypothetical protein